MAGIASSAWGLHLPERWLAAGLVLLWVALALSGGPGARPGAPLAFFWLVGVALCQQALQPDFPPHHLVRLPQEGEVTLLGRLNRPSEDGRPSGSNCSWHPEAWRSPRAGVPPPAISW